MAATFTKTATVTVGSGGASTIEFTSIDSSYTDLCLLLSVRQTNSNYGEFLMRFNSSSANYTYKNALSDGSSATGTSGNQIYWDRSDSTSNTFSSARIYIPNYAGSTYKSASIENAMENNATFAWTQLKSFLWSDTSAITTISFGTFDNGFPDKFAQYSTATLYGIKNS